MSIFGGGSNYPPGAANDPNAPYNQVDGPCLVCGLFEDDCMCPECPECGTFGDPDCYEKHGLTKTPQQIESLAKQEALWEAENAAVAEREALMADQEATFWKEMGEPPAELKACRHGNPPESCDTCDHESDIAFDASRERA